MKFKQFMSLIKQFDCKALEDKEIEHCFADNMYIGYTEKITDFVYDAERKTFRIITGEIKETVFTSNNFIQGKTAQQGSLLFYIINNMKDELTNKMIKAINKIFSEENMNKIFKKVSDKIKEKEEYNGYWR